MQYLTLLILALCCYTSLAEFSCKRNAREVERKLKKLFWIGEKAQIPRTEADIDQFCENTRELIKDVTAHRACISPFSKVILSVVHRQIRKFGKKLCVDKKRKQETLTRLQCVNENNIQQLYYCPHRAFVQLNHVAKTNKNEGKDTTIASFCCIMHQVHQCTAKNMKKVRSACATGSTTSSSSVGQLLGGMSGETTELLCSKFSSYEVCQRDFGEGLRKLEQIADANQVPFEKTPIIQPLFALADRLSES